MDAVKDYEPIASFGADMAAVYDDEPRGDEDDAVAFLAHLAGEGPALELAIGTGRIGLPLAATGVRVDGIELSPDMIDQLRAKPGGADLDITMGDFAAVDVDDRYALVYVVFNTIHNLLTQDDQVRCFANVARHLTDDGVFLVEARVPWHMPPLDQGRFVRLIDVGTDEADLDVGRWDPSTQQYEVNHLHLTEQGIRFSP